jgi:hypothetical protein
MPTQARKFPEPQAYSDKPRPAIPLVPVDSSQVDRVGYDAESKTLAVQFKHGAKAIYHYPNVEPETHAAFMAAESKGVFFREHIKALPFEKFAAEPEAEQSADQAPAGGTAQTAVEA